MKEGMPSPEDLNRIQKENLTEEEIVKDKIREEAYNAGQKHKEQEILTKMPDNELDFKRNVKKFAAEVGLSPGIEELFLKGEFRSAEDSLGLSGSFDRINPSENVTEDQLLKTLDELQELDEYGFCHNPSVFTRPVMKKMLEKFPDVEFCCSNGQDARMKKDMYEVLKELGQDERAENWKPEE